MDIERFDRLARVVSDGPTPRRFDSTPVSTVGPTRTRSLHTRSMKPLSSSPVDPINRREIRSAAATRVSAVIRGGPYDDEGKGGFRWEPRWSIRRHW